MNRSIIIDVRRNTWPKPGRGPDFPSSFHMGEEVETISIPSMLLMIGYLTTPPSSSGVSLSEFWAWVRYLSAISAAAPDDGGMRVTRGFSSLDPHQKTILSDDFGMGVPMLWLTQRLRFDRICDGRYFLERFAANVEAEPRRGARRGSNKTPDFVARDLSGVWHVIECKGTQSGRKYSEWQMGSGGPETRGGVAQKLAIRFPKGYTGQRLVCGLQIATHGGKDDSRLTIIDPEPEEPVRIRKSQINYAEDAAERSVVSKALRLAGFEATADTTASPWGPTPVARRATTRTGEDRRREMLEARDQLAREELSRATDRDAVFEQEDVYRGRTLAFDLPRPIEINGRRVLKVVIRQGVNADVLAELREQPSVDTILAESDRQWRQSLGPTKLEHDEFTATMTIGQLFRSRIDLE